MGVSFISQIKRRLLLAAVGVSLAAALPAAQAADASLVRIGYQKGGVLLLVKTQGLLDKRLNALGYKTQWIEFAAGPQMLEGLNVGAIDFAGTGAPPPVFAQANGTDFVYVGAEPVALQGEAVIVKADSPLRSVADLKGKRIALQKGSSSHYLLIVALAKAGLRYEDVQPVFLTPGDARAAFEKGAVDAWIIWDPHLAIVQKAVSLRVLADYTGLQPPWSFYEARREFAARRGDALKAILQQIAETDVWQADHSKEVIDLVAPVLGVDKAALEISQRRARFGVVPINDAIVADQQKVADIFLTQKLIRERIDVKAQVWVPGH